MIKIKRYCKKIERSCSQLLRAITGPSFCWSAFASSGASYRRDSWAIISTSSLHVTQEVPLPPYFSIVFDNIEDNVQFGWGESWRRKFLLYMLSYFGNLVIFCLILKFLKFFILVSMVIKEKFSKWNERNWIFFSLDLDFVLCLLKLMNCWSFYWIQP